MRQWLKNALPRNLYGRAALIVILPILSVQLVVSVVFIERHFRDVTRQMTRGVAQEVAFIQDEVQSADDPAARLAELAPVLSALTIEARLEDGAAPLTRRLFYDLSGRFVVQTLTEMVPGVKAVDLVENKRQVHVYLDRPDGVLRIIVPRQRVSASNPHQLLVLMIGTGILMTLIAFLFLRNQLRPIKRLARAAEAFGRGQSVPFKPTGAIEVRAAGNAFLNMRARIDRHIEQRTLMLLGVSHDIRTPLTRLKLGLSMLDDCEDTEALQQDVTDMERMLDSFLEFARAERVEDPTITDPAALVTDLAQKMQVNVGRVDQGPPVPLRALGVARALQNLVSNAQSYGTNCRISLERSPKTLRFSVEDDGPGIPADKRDVAMQPFSRLDESRNLTNAPGVGLGLAIATDIARAHGGTLRLGESTDMGGLRADVILPI